MTLSMSEREYRRIKEDSTITRGEKLILKIVVWAEAEGITTERVKAMNLDSLSPGSVRVMFSRLVRKGLIKAARRVLTGRGGARTGIYVATDLGKEAIS